jgi:hypothetical protein
MTNDDKNDKELNDYLNGDSDLSKAYRESNRSEPSVQLDEKILSVAKETVETTKQNEKLKFYKAPWVKPVSIAAIITLSVSLVVTMQQEAGKPLISELDVDMYDSTVIIKDSKVFEAIQSSDPKNSINEIEVKKTEGARVEVPAAADLYRAEEKAEAPKARMKKDAANRMLLKEQSQSELLEERALAEEQIMPSVSTGAEFDDVISLSQEYEVSRKNNSSFSNKNRMYVNNRFGFKLRLPDNLCLAKSNGSHVYIFDKDIHKNDFDKDWGKPSLLNGTNIHGEVSVFENTEFVDQSLDKYLETLPDEFDNWTKSEEYKISTLIYASKVEINNHEYIKEFYSVSLNKKGKEEYQRIKGFVSDRFGLEPITPDDTINIILIKGFKDKFQYNFYISFRDEIINEDSINIIIDSFELVPIQEKEDSSVYQIYCHNP